MERTIKVLKGIGVVAIASFTSIALLVPNTSVEAAETETQSNSVLAKLFTDVEREIDMTPEDAAYLQALREHYDRD